MQLAAELKKEASGLCALVVEDEQNLRMQVVTFLRKFFRQVVEAGDGKAALEVLSKESVDIVLTDIRMPEMDGQK